MLSEAPYKSRQRVVPVGPDDAFVTSLNSTFANMKSARSGHHSHQDFTRGLTYLGGRATEVVPKVGSDFLFCKEALRFPVKLEHGADWFRKPSVCLVQGITG